MASYPCATCGHPVEYEGALPARFPFCCERCRMVDLGKWLREEYAIDRDLTPEDLAEFGERLPPELRK
ncbi:MAG: DNA gyrase inhibitor YacG [Phycisphaerales bacterium]|nr:DNA gyrase inhibitor YacG [Phycisphaerales bacterium]